MFLAFTFAVVTGSASLDATKVTLSAPRPIVEFNVKKLKGELFRLAWSPDGGQLYIQTIERNRVGVINAAHHYLVSLDGTPPKSVDTEPEWSTKYWGWKSAQTAPGVPALKIEVEQQQKRVSGTSLPMGGDLARGGSDGSSSGASMAGVSTSTNEAAAAAVQSQMVNYYTLKLKGEVVGEFVNAPAIPGVTFGWGPAGTGLIAFSSQPGRVVIMDDQGRKQEIPSSKSTLLPAWTDDGKRLGYLERNGKDKVVLHVVDVTLPVQ
jgi:hypothetical protein